MSKGLDEFIWIDRDEITTGITLGRSQTDDTPRFVPIDDDLLSIRRILSMQVDEDTPRYEKIDAQKLLELNRYLIDRLIELTISQQKTTESLNERIESFEKEIVRLRNKIDEMRKARMLTVRIPKSWVLDAET